MVRFVELVWFVVESKTRFYSRHWHGRSQSEQSRTRSSSVWIGERKINGIVKGDTRGAPASDFEGKIDARKKKHTKRKVTMGENRVWEKESIYNIDKLCLGWELVLNITIHLNIITRIVSSSEIARRISRCEPSGREINLMDPMVQCVS